MPTKCANELHDLVRRVLIAAGADEQNAADVADHLVLASLSGVDSHGIWPLPIYVKAIKAGELLPRAKPKILKDSVTSALVSGGWTFGHVAAKYATQVAIDKAHESGVAIVGLVQSHHIGRLGHFVEMANAEGMICMLWSGGYGVETPTAVPYGGRKPVLHTNPIAIGFPGGEESSMMFDFATTAISGVKVVNAQRRGEQLPPGCIVDKNGSPTTNPNDLFSGGGHLPFGGHKGYGLMMAAEFLGRIFTGADRYAEEHVGGPVMRHQGVTILTMRTDLFRPLADYSRQADDMERKVRAIPSAPGFKEVLVPGDLESRTRRTRSQTGIPIDEDLWQSIIEAAAAVGVNAEECSACK